MLWQYELLHLVRPLLQAEDARVAEQALGVEVAAEPVAAVDLDDLARDPPGQRSPERHKRIGHNLRKLADCR